MRGEPRCTSAQVMQSCKYKDDNTEEMQKEREASGATKKMGKIQFKQQARMTVLGFGLGSQQEKG